MKKFTTMTKNQVVKVSPGGSFGAREPRMARASRESGRRCASEPRIRPQIRMWTQPRMHEQAVNLVTNPAANLAANVQVSRESGCKCSSERESKKKCKLPLSSKSLNKLDYAHLLLVSVLSQ